jgi:DNA polymerase-1
VSEHLATAAAPPRRARRRSASPSTYIRQAPLAELLLAASRLEVSFRISGNGFEVARPERLPDDLYATLRGRQPELWDYLGGTALHQPSLDLLTQLGVRAAVPQTRAEAQMLLDRIEADSDRHTPVELRDRPGLIGLDSETMALPGTEERPPIKLTRRGVPVEHQPPLKSDAGLDPRRSRVRLVQLYGGGDVCAVIDTDLVPLDIITPLLSRRTAVAHSVGFELQHLGHAGIAVPHIECTAQAAGLLLGVRRRGLDDATEAYLGVTLPKQLQLSDWGAPVLHPGQIAYAALDAIAVFWLWPKLRAELVSKGRLLAYRLQRDVTPVAVRMTARGVHLDRNLHRQKVTEWSQALGDARQTFTDATGLPPPTTPDAIRAYLQEILPPEYLAAWPLTPKSRKLSIRGTQLSRVAHLPAIRPLLDINAMETLLEGFGAALVEKISKVTGRIHPSYHIASTKAGRSSSSRPNIQQIPTAKKAPGFRDCITAAPGYILVIADFAMMELRAAAAISGDLQMTEDFANGVDFHTRLAAEKLGIPEEQVTPEQRNGAKPINFGTIYGAGGAGLAASAWNTYGIALTVEEASADRARFLQRYAAYAQWMRRHATLCNHLGRIEIGHLGRVIEAAWEQQEQKSPHRRAGTLWGSATHLDDPYAEQAVEAELPEEDDSAWYQNGWADDLLKYTLCCNAPIQGACADIAMLAVLKADAAFTAAKIDGGLVLFIHDELGAEVVEHQAEQARVLLTTAMTEAFSMVFREAPLNKVVASAIGRSWGAAKP